MPAEGKDPGPDALTQAQQRRADQRAVDQDRTLAAMHQLEAALGAAAPAREEAEHAAQPDSLLSDIARTQPWLRNRVRGLRIHYRQLRDAIAALKDELGAAAGQPVDFTDIRQRLAWVLAGLRHQQARESDLIYEAYYDVFRSDIPRDAAGQLPGR